MSYPFEWYVQSSVVSLTQGKLAEKNPVIVMLHRTRKLIKSLQLKKSRKEEQCFVVEGAKNVQELLMSDFTIITVAASSGFLTQNEQQLRIVNATIEESSEKELTASGTLQTNNAAIAIARMKPNLPPQVKEEEYLLALDDIRDPGNAGTIIRTADWFGIGNIIASEETADFYNTKTISSSMGSFCRVNVYYVSLPDFLRSNKQKKYGAFLEGEDVHRISFSKGGIIIIGNESNGISAEVGTFVDQKITIPGYGGAESLNAGISTAIILDNLRRSVPSLR